MDRLTPIPFYYLRHGETDWNRQRIMQGHTDTPLSAYGLQQAAEIAPAVARLDIATICCSPLQRARRTAEIVGAVRGKPLVEIPALKECAFGIYEGQASNGPWREPWLAGGSIPGGESYSDYLARALRGLNESLCHPAPVMVVAHGGTFWAIEKFALRQAGVRVTNCALFKLIPPQNDQSGAWAATLLAAPRGPAVAIGEARTE